ncbi:DUF952 domain-containing protein [Microbacterium sp. A93]|uniref:DUF952 domain-containing protein n=1 Tax=Microbacterium sp. A93 TaxID=3450716 RepID=UPI003F422F92
MLLQHIAESEEWARAREAGFYDRSTRGASIEQVGFLHASSGPDQVATVLAAVYADATEPLVLLTLDPAALYRAGLQVVLEPGDPRRPDGEWFPHVYGGPIPVAAVADVVPIDRPVRDGDTDGAVLGGAQEVDDASRMMDEAHLARAIDLATVNASSGGGPFGAVVVASDGQVFQGANQVTATNDPTAHAEVEAIRAAGAGLGNFDLTGAVVYASCEPCPMCLGAALWSRVSRVVFAAGRLDAAAAGFDDAAFYSYFESAEHRGLMPVLQHRTERSAEPFTAWRANEARTAY